MKKLTAVMDPDFQEAHRLAFRQKPLLVAEGDVVFLWDHYWPATVIRANTGDSNIIVSTPTALDGITTFQYNWRYVRPCNGWAVPTKEEAAALSETL